MKWGIRRYQNSDGSLTAAGKKRYGDSEGTKNQNGSNNKKSKYRTKLENRYMELGMTKRQAAISADRRIKTEKIVAAAAGITLAACAAYAVNDELKSRADRIIESGSTLQRIQSNDSKDLRDVFYASFGRHDNKRYAAVYPGYLKEQHGVDSHKMNLKTNAKIKVAGRDNAIKEFSKLFNNNKEFRDNIGMGEIKPEQVTKKDFEYLYDRFNRYIPFGQRELDDSFEKTSKANKMFFDTMKNKGYDAIVDVNDKGKKYSGMMAKSPLIVFNNSDNKMTVESVEKIDYKLGKDLVEQTKAWAERNTPGAARATLIGVGAKHLMKPKLSNGTYNTLIKQYRKDHPGTRMSNDEIRKMYEKQFEKNRKNKKNRR